MGRSASIALLLVAAHHVLVWSSLRSTIFPGTRLPPYPGALPRDVVRLELRHDEGVTHGLLRPAPAGAPSPAPLVVYFHGNYELAEEVPWHAAPYGALGCALLVVEYRGYGGSTGTPSEAHVVEDTLGLVALAAECAPLDLQRVVLHGRSIGGGLAAAVARSSPPRGLILESSLSSVVSMGRGYGVPPYLVRDRLDVADCLAHHYRGPVLVLHCRSDEVIPVREARRNVAAAANARLVLADGIGHQVSWLGHDPGAIADFVAAAIARR